MRAIVFLVLSALPVSAQTIGGAARLGGQVAVSVPAGTLAIQNVDPHFSDTTIWANFSTTTFATVSMACGTVLGTYNIPSVDANTGGPIQHKQIVPGLAPSTTYFCQITAVGGTTVTYNFSITTSATPASAAITSLSLGTPNPYNSINVSNQGNADTFYNHKCGNGVTYMVNDDSTGFFISGAPAYEIGQGGQQNIMQVLSESPLTIQTIYRFPNYGSFNPVRYLGDGLSSKAFGILCVANVLYLDIGRQNQASVQSGGGFAQTAGNIISSNDFGQTWNSPDNPALYGSVPPSSLTSTMWPGSSPTTMGSCAFVKFGADDGTLGYGVALNQHDNGNAFAYLVCNEGEWAGGGSQGGGNALYLARVARAKLQNLSGSDYQWYTGGDGNLSANWSSTKSSAVAILTNTGELGTPEVVYYPNKNRFLILTFFYPTGVTNGGNNLNCTWLGYEAKDLWGTWTQIYSQNFSSGALAGSYNPIVLSDTIYSGNTPTVLFTNGFGAGSGYVPHYATLTIN